MGTGALMALRTVVQGAVLAVLGAAALAPGGCADACTPAPFATCTADTTLPNVDAPTWYHDIAPIVAARCVRCHNAGGLAPFPLETHAQLADEGDAIARVVENRTMPPFMPAPCCNHFRDDTSLTDTQRAQMLAWIAGGMPEGAAADVGAPLPAVGVLPRKDLTLTMRAEYMPNVSAHDDTRCFLLDWPLTETTFVTGFGVTPGVRGEVHHALVVTAPGDQRAAMEELDGKDAGEGWSCPGGVIWGIDDYVGAWSPAWEGVTMPPLTGHKVDSDDVVILTVHYTRPHDDTAVVADRTSVDLMLAARVDHMLTSIAVVDGRWLWGGMPIPKDDPAVYYAAEYDPTSVYSNGKPITAVGVNLHMHERGNRGLVGIRHQDGSETCLLQIDAYDHAWQGDYSFTAPIMIAPGDRVHVECVFDNTLGHQRVVGGAPEEPRDLNWAEDGEMCVGFITILTPG